MTTPSPTLGGSRVADAIGLGWASPIRLYGELVGDPGFPPREDTEAMRLGRRLQPVIFAELNDTGYPCMEYPVAYEADGSVTYSKALSRPERPWLIGHPDGRGVQSLDGSVFDSKAQGYPHVDLSARIQTLVYEHLGDYSTGYVATLAGLRVEVEEIPRDEEKIGRILALTDRFWEYVQEKRWPPPTGHPDDRAAISDAYPNGGGGKIRETRAVREARRELAILNAQDGKHGVRTRRKAFLAGVVTAHMGDAEHLISAEGETVAKWTPVTSRRMDTDAIRKAYPDLADAHTTDTHSRRLTVS